jgi:alcohol dehydrogenase (cytochrome c)
LNASFGILVVILTACSKQDDEPDSGNLNGGLIQSETTYREDVVSNKTFISESDILAAEQADTQPPSQVALPAYTSSQAEQGNILYQEMCIACHGTNLDNGAFAPPITGDLFYGLWGGRSVAELQQYIKESMPPGSPGKLSDADSLELIAYLFQVEGIPAGQQALSLDSKTKTQLLPIPDSGLAVKETIEVPPPPNTVANPLDKITPVTDDMLADPPAADWLMWRRSYDGQGFSPLEQLTSSNVKNLKLVWSWTMPAGRNIATPLVHDGVMFMYGVGSNVYAFNAQTGDLLWRYQPALQPRPFGPRAISIYKDTIILTTDHGHVVALAVKTGEVVWDSLILKPEESDENSLFPGRLAMPIYFSAGTLVAEGKILVSTSTAERYEKNFIAALDANTGEEVWRFYTVEPQGGLRDTWNRVSSGQRQGAGMYVPPSYDPAQKLVLLGTGNSYNAPVLREPQYGASSNAALHTNSTLALDLDTGKLAWSFQHLPNDQWNYDWAYERIITTLPVNGVNQKTVIASGKQAIFDTLDINQGDYQFSIDLGLQNVVKAIDPITGDKEISAETFPTQEEMRLACPDTNGARTWRPAALNPDSNALYIPFREACMNIGPHLSGYDVYSGYGRKTVPWPESDGNFGGLFALDLKTREPLWTHRKRAIPSSGILATAGNLLFYGSTDRVFSAHDLTEGKELWQARLNGIPSGAPISFSIAGKQYIAVVAGDRNEVYRLDPNEEHKNPKNISATIWVFALP